jgi:hypothetical protein
MRIPLIISFCLISAVVFPQDEWSAAVPQPDAQFAERGEKQFKFYPGGKMTIQSEVPGRIRIVGWKKSLVRVENEKIVRCPDEHKAKVLMDKHPVRVRYNQTSATIQVESSSDGDPMLECNLVIYVPGDRTDLKATLIRGDISLEAVNGWIEVTTGEGNLQADAMSGYFSGSTPKGNIRIEMSGKRWSGLEFGAVTRAGTIDLVLPEGFSAALQLETRNGSMIVDYPPQMVDGEPVPLQVGIRKKAQALEASLGSGGAPIKLISQAGDIRLSVKK